MQTHIILAIIELCAIVVRVITRRLQNILIGLLDQFLAVALLGPRLAGKTKLASNTGAEALYADMGHFGLIPIRYAWFGFVFPALLLNYLGQGALLINHPVAIQNPFYLLAPNWALYP